VMHGATEIESSAFLKNCPSAFKQTLSERVAWKNRLPSIAPKISRHNSTGIFYLEIWK
jgi:hypothetical protein